MSSIDIHLSQSIGDHILIGVQKDKQLKKGKAIFKKVRPIGLLIVRGHGLNVVRAAQQRDPCLRKLLLQQLQLHLKNGEPLGEGFTPNFG